MLLDAEHIAILSAGAYLPLNVLPWSARVTAAELIVMWSGRAYLLLNLLP